MSRDDSNQNAGGDDQNDSAGQNDQDGKPNEEAGGQKTVSHDTYTKLLDEKKKLQREVKELRSGTRAKDEELATKSGDLTKVLEIREKTIKELQDQIAERDTELGRHRKRTEVSEKMNSLLEAIDGEVPKKFWQLLPLDKVVFDPETGEVDQASVKQAARQFRDDYGDVIKKAGGIGNLPNNDPSGRGNKGKITAAEYAKLPLSEMKKYGPNDIIYDKKRK